MLSAISGSIAESASAAPDAALRASCFFEITTLNVR